MSARIPQRAVAEAAGVSLATVSRVYSGHPGISAKTREHVQAVGRELGYRPSPGLSAVQSARWQGKHQAFSRVAVVRTPDPDQRKYAGAVMAQKSRFPSQIREHGYSPEWLDTTHQTAAALRRKLESLRVDGVIIPMVPKLPGDIVDVFTAWPCVGMMAQTTQVAFPVVHLDDLMHAHEVFRRVADAGYQRTGVVMAEEPFSRGVLGRLGGLLGARALRSSTAIPILRIDSSGPQGIPEYVKQHHCDSLIVQDSHLGKTLRTKYPELRRLGLACLMVSQSDSECSGILNAPGLYHERVLNLLDQMVRGNILGSQLSDLRESVHFQWQEGNTLLRFSPKKGSLGK